MISPNDTANAAMGGDQPSPTPKTTTRARVHLAAIAAFVVIGVTTVVTSQVARGIVNNQQQRLLAERSGEVAALLAGSLNGTRSSMAVLGTVSQAGAQPSTAFASSAQALLTGGAKTIGVTSDQRGTLVVTDAVGDGPAVGATLTGGRDTLARHALTAGNLVSTVVADSTGSRLVLDMPVGSPPTAVVYYETAINPTKPIPSTRESPFRELEVDLYAAPRADPAQLVVTTKTDSKRVGKGHQDVFSVGADKWLIVTNTTRPLTGSAAAALPWLILGVGLLVAVLVGLVVDVLARRRSYALALVEQRTVALRRAQETAEMANLAKSEFLSRMSHELRTPLNAVLGFAQLLEIGELTDDQRESVAHVLKGGRHLLDLINEVLDISHIEAGRLALSPEPVLASEMIADTLQLVAPLAAEQSIHLLDSAGPQCDVFVFADRQRIKQILLNLLSNAIKYNRPRGSVALSCAPHGEHRLRISVTDTGPGINPEHLELLFTPFERLGAETTDIDGVGIGLALSRRLAEAMGGTLDLETTPGRGSTFYVELPLVEGPVERYERLNVDLATPQQPVGTTRRKVLHIEDNLSNLKLLERILEHRGDVEVVAAMQGRLGLELAREHNPALILLDLHLPDVDGDEILQRLRSDPATAAIPVVMVSADATPRQIQRLLASGATAYLTKPIDVRQLLDILDNTLTPG